jgi:hypothetical protein
MLSLYERFDDVPKILPPIESKILGTFLSFHTVLKKMSSFNSNRFIVGCLVGKIVVNFSMIDHWVSVPQNFGVAAENASRRFELALHFAEKLDSLTISN